MSSFAMAKLDISNSTILSLYLNEFIGVIAGGFTSKLSIPLHCVMDKGGENVCHEEKSHHLLVEKLQKSSYCPYQAVYELDYV